MFKWLFFFGMVFFWSASTILKFTGVVWLWFGWFSAGWQLASHRFLEVNEGTFWVQNGHCFMFPSNTGTQQKGVPENVKKQYRPFFQCGISCWCDRRETFGRLRDLKFWIPDFMEDGFSESVSCCNGDSITIYPGSQPRLKKFWFLLDDDTPLP